MIYSYNTYPSFFLAISPYNLANAYAFIDPSIGEGVASVLTSYNIATYLISRPIVNYNGNSISFYINNAYIASDSAQMNGGNISYAYVVFG